MHELKQKNQITWICDDAKSYFQREWFELRSGNTLQASAGRQPVYRFEAKDHHFVLRHYFRGGVPAYFTKDRFLFRGWQATRPYQELNILQAMIQVGLPVPYPVAARCRTTRLSYTADIIMHEIPGAQPIAEILTKRALTSAEWSEIGNTIRRFHRLGFQHVDLNATNILLDGNSQIHLVDFDRCKRRKYSKGWAMASIVRLQRSLNKLQSTNQDFNYELDDFNLMLKAYSE